MAARLKIKTAYLNIRLNKIPALKLEPRPPLTEAEKKEIKSLIAKLAEIDSPDYGMAATLSGSAFAPVAGHEHWGAGLLTDHQLKRSGTLTELVSKGPAALPFLLDALEIKTPSKLRMDNTGLMLSFGSQLNINPINARERLITERKAKLEEEDDDDDRQVSSPLCVGDICFVALGQIVGRHYQAVHYIPSGWAAVNSPARNKEFRDRIRAIWSSEDPNKKLLDSLLLDYSTDGIFNGTSLDGWYEGSERQIEAAMRLLYYFPKESAAMIAERLKDMETKKPKPGLEAWMMREVKNGVRTTDFLKAVNWCQEPTVRDALLDVFRRTDDAALMLAALPSVQESHRELVMPRFQILLNSLP